MRQQLSVYESVQGVRMKHEKKQDAWLEKLTLADARKRVDEFKHVKQIAGKPRGAAAPPRNDAKGSPPKGKS
jgi:hypothetical protein